MSHTAEIVERLLDVLSLAGHASLVERYRLEFDSRGADHLTQADVARVSRCIADPAACDARPPPGTIERLVPERVPGPAAAFDSKGWSPVRDYGLFVDALPNGRRLLGTINRLALAEGPQQALDAASCLFVDVLGYDPGGHDETGRLSEQQTIRRLTRIGRFGEYVVSLAITDYAGPYATVCGPIFRLHPYGLVVWLIPTRRMVRFVYRDGVERAYSMRTLSGGRAHSEPHDNLIIWAARLAQLEPRPGDTGFGLVERTKDALSAPPHAIWGQRASAPLSGERDAPGIAWPDVWRRGFEAFVQGGAEPPRWHWGLVRVLRERFPMFVAGGEARLLLRTWRLGRAPSRAEPRQVQLSMTLAAGAASEEFSIEAWLPYFDESGGWSSRGQRWRLIPQVRDGGRLFNRPIEEEADTIEDEWSLIETEGLTDGDDTEPDFGAIDADDSDSDEDHGEVSNEADDSQTPAEGSDESEFEGADLCTLLEIAVARKLGAVARRLWGASADIASVRDVFIGLHDMDGTFHLASGQYLRAAMTPVPLDDTLPVIVTGPDVRPVPPAWACLDLAADLPLGRWHPIAGARLSPAGGLAVPLADEAGRVTLRISERTGFEVNPRCGGDAGSARRHWIAAPLRRWATLPVGQLACASWLVRNPSVTFSADMHIRAASQTVLRVSEAAHIRWPHRAPQTIVADIPAAEVGEDDNSERAPTLHVELGQHIEAGEIWLSAPRALWGMRRPSILADECKGARGLVTSTFLRDPEQPGSIDAVPSWTAGVEHALYRLPSAAGGVVVEADISERRARGGQLRGWRARLIVRPLSESDDLIAWLPDGRVVNVELTPPGAFPMGGDGNSEADFILDDAALPATEPHPWRLPDDPWSDGEHRRAQPLTLMRIQRASKCNGHQPRRWRDGGWLPSTGGAGFTERERRRWSLLQPQYADVIDAHERAWSGGVPSYVPALADLLVMARIDPVRLGYRPPTIRYLNGNWGPRLSGSRAQVRLEPEAIEGHRVDWSCRCGAISGPHRAMEICGRPFGSTGERNQKPVTPILGCGERALPVVRVPDDWPAVSLPERVPHPWRQEAIAALLGLTADELRERFIRLGGDVISELVRGAWTEPFAAAQRRLEDSISKAIRQALLRGASDLNRLLEAGISRHALMLRWLPLPSERVCPDGYRPGAPDLVRAPLTLRYRRLVRAGKRLLTLRTRAGVPMQLLLCGRASLLDSVDDLFGNPDMKPPGEPNCLASLLRRIWPLSSPPKLRSGLPGLLVLRGARLAEDDEVGVPRRCVRDPFAWLDGSRPLVGEQLDRERPDLNLSDFEFDVPLLPADPRRRQMVVAMGPDAVVADEAEPLTPEGLSGDDWYRKITHYRFWERVAAPLAVFFGAMTWPESVGIDPSEWPSVDEVLTRGPSDDGVPIGRMLTAPFFRRLDEPAALCALLTRDVPLWLPAEPSSARAKLGPILTAAFPGEGPLMIWGRELLAGILAGWNLRRRPEVGQSQWMWSAGLAASGVRRGVPPLGHRAWRAWPGAAAEMEPVRWFATLGRWNAAVRALGRLDRPSLPTPYDKWHRQRSEPIPAPTHTMPDRLIQQSPRDLEAPPAARTEDTRPLIGTIAEWLAGLTRTVREETQ